MNPIVKTVSGRKNMSVFVEKAMRFHQQLLQEASDT